MPGVCQPDRLQLPPVPPDRPSGAGHRPPGGKPMTGRPEGHPPFSWADIMLASHAAATGAQVTSIRVIPRDQEPELWPEQQPQLRYRPRRRS
jgi:hypothetical protein